MSEPQEPVRTLGLRCMSVVVAGAVFGFRLDEVQEVIGRRPVTRVFHAPPSVVGVTSLRGEVLPILDLGVLVGSRPVAAQAESRVVVVGDRAPSGRRAGVLVDALASLRELPADGLAPVPQTAQRAVELLLGIIPSPPPCSVLSVPAVFDLVARGTPSATGGSPG